MDASADRPAAPPSVPAEDAEELKSQGVAAVFTPGAPTSEIVDFLKQKVPA